MSDRDRSANADRPVGAGPEGQEPGPEASPKAAVLTMNSEIEREAVADALGQYFNTIGIGLKIKTKREAAAAAIAAMPSQSLLAQAQEALNCDDRVFDLLEALKPVLKRQGIEIAGYFARGTDGVDWDDLIAALQPNAGEGR